ncbi:MAG: hypothetical protein ABEK59_02130 [Halobacteria archaeon]
MLDFIEKDRRSERRNQPLDEELVPFQITNRHIITAPKGKVLVAVDVKNEELYFIAVLSGDKVMQDAFLQPGKLPLLNDQNEQVTDENGDPVYYKNPHSDLHLKTCKECCFPELFEGQPEHLWDQIARDDNQIQFSGNPRFWGKKDNFAIAYLQSIQAMADLNNVPYEVAESWQKNHAKLYRQAHEWINIQRYLAKERGWAKNALGRIRWVETAAQGKPGEIRETL